MPASQLYSQKMREKLAEGTKDVDTNKSVKYVFDQFTHLQGAGETFPLFNILLLHIVAVIQKIWKVIILLNIKDTECFTSAKWKKIYAIPPSWLPILSKAHLLDPQSWRDHVAYCHSESLLPGSKCCSLKSEI